MIYPSFEQIKEDFHYIHSKTLNNFFPYFCLKKKQQSEINPQVLEFDQVKSSLYFSLSSLISHLDEFEG